MDRKTDSGKVVHETRVLVDGKTDSGKVVHENGDLVDGIGRKPLGDRNND